MADRFLSYATFPLGAEENGLAPTPCPSPFCYSVPLHALSTRNPSPGVVDAGDVGVGRAYAHWQSRPAQCAPADYRCYPDDARVPHALLLSPPRYAQPVDLEPTISGKLSVFGVHRLLPQYRGQLLWSAPNDRNQCLIAQCCFARLSGPPFHRCSEVAVFGQNLGGYRTLGWGRGGDRHTRLVDGHRPEPIQPGRSALVRDTAQLGALHYLWSPAHATHFPLAATTYAYMAGAFFLVLGSGFTEWGTWTPTDTTLASWLAIAYQSTLGTLAHFW